MLCYPDGISGLHIVPSVCIPRSLPLADQTPHLWTPRPTLTLAQPCPQVLSFLLSGNYVSRCWALPYPDAQLPQQDDWGLYWALLLKTCVVARATRCNISQKQVYFSVLLAPSIILHGKWKVLLKFSNLAKPLMGDFDMNIRCSGGTDLIRPVGYVTM